MSYVNCGVVLCAALRRRITYATAHLYRIRKNTYINISKRSYVLSLEARYSGDNEDSIEMLPHLIVVQRLDSPLSLK